MSTSLSLIGKQIIIYGGLPVFIAGTVGGLLNTLVFLSLRTFRQSSCAFYLTIMSILSIIQLCLALLARVITAISSVDATETSLFYCKSRLYLINTCNVISMTCFCLATIDQYCATCSNLHWQQFCNIKLARRIIIIFIIIWILHGIPYLVFYDHVSLPNTNKFICIVTNQIFDQYRGFFMVLGLIGFLPITIAALFGSMAFRNIKEMPYRTVPLVRRELDKQLTVMVLVQVVVGIFGLLPYTTVFAVATNKNLTSDPVIQAKLQFATTVTVIIYYTYFASPFYVYICVSERFRKQLFYVLFNIHLNRWRRRRIIINHVAPET
ncbi:unnamed protein product [Rotaria sordida]|uniref:G-protein coupled receptors family 1 profile domain-containing protein n=1 Tax=Rotaria sordida TaxID=392033 RepID=A0A815C0V8_9BILA|nr:unnamed protein product [Rotaria sordida]CAF0968637.1 unnamed protein product [Rotaria sordida]CAF1085443.1 unnamed protein product [Rotaria sordida]CAF1276732.1 unnamed protein product [Rotaria sordida]CAF3987717.1 unnamed protein product [Rotaria sordida]